ncbi:structural maintenance of chromosome complex subunit SmcA [Talaromyces proteolyticus]|uniref:Structural maintenance of chromosomes protein 5 n=1 Tax=Talaromyces proteolyticus TaxID=1131652 RepID=A0AAD4Q6D8_9EURO|nr:structural maintenance of chromosome complex subunit SmcA [Talaromyces proteolyticus]KAH8705596.1 structural maintenance of chromosome complex subunit SmcA [Talaromyces proteolyticus]
MSSSLQIPPSDRRRRRRVEEDSDDDDEPSTRGATPLSQSSSGSKRIKLHRRSEVVNDDEQEDEDDEDEDERNGDGPQSKVSLSRARLPDGYTTHGDFQPGAIVRIKLTNFVTYTSAEFFPGPKLNMVIGPNGTGKSTLVCAICLGLGWGPQHLGRAKDASEFVKHGCREATIEIELARGPPFKTNPIITRTIKHDGNKNTFTINGKDSNRKQVQSLARQFSIQVDNLCQFLPQDKVSEFAALSPIDLLQSTQRAAAGPQMIEWHENLKKLRAEQKKLSLDNKGDRDLLTNLENRQELQRADVERMRERAQVKRRIEMLELARPVVRFKDHTIKYQEIKNDRTQLNHQLEDLKAELEPALRAVLEKEDYYRKTDDLVKYKRKKFNRAEIATSEIAKKMEAHEDKMKELVGQIETERKIGSNHKQEASKIQQAINRFTRQMEEEPEEFDLDSYNERLRSLNREIRDLREKAEEIKGARIPLHENLNEKNNQIEIAENELANLASQSGQQAAVLRKVSSDTYKAYRWLQENSNKFENEVFGPALVTCSVKDPKYADTIESLLQRNDLLAFTTQSTKDFRTLQKALNGELRLHDVSIRACTTQLSDFRPPISDEELYDLGFDGWAKDYLTGPEPVIAMLCNEQFLFKTPVVLRDITDQEYSRMESHAAINSWVAGKQTYKVTRRREYGPGATSTSVKQVRPARVWTNQPVDLSMKQELLETISRCKEEKVEIEEQIKIQRAELSRISEEHKTKNKERMDLEHEKSEKQTALVNFRALPERLNQQMAKKKEMDKKFEKLRSRVREIRSRQDEVAIEKAEAATAYADAVESLRKLQQDLMLAEFRNIEASSDLESVKERNIEIQNILKAKEQEVEEATRLLREASLLGVQYRNEANKILALARSQPDLSELLLDQCKEMTSDQLEADIDSEKARLELAHEGSAGLIKEYEDRQKAITKLQEKLSRYQSKLADYEHAINEIREEWEPRLDALVQKISDAFSDSFDRIGCAGQVSVDKVEDEPGPNGERGGSDFDQWSIQIQVKFREHENLSLLDSHRQSGGERAVSTIFYLMALQSLSASPFRVVDEINQGMDPRNERMVHERMVDIACAARTPVESGADDLTGAGGSQYFLITPKLLNGLVYKPGMKVLCIVSGEHVPADYSTIDFGRAIQTMSKISGIPARTAPNNLAREKGKGRAMDSGRRGSHIGVSMRA